MVLIDYKAPAATDAAFIIDDDANTGDGIVIVPVAIARGAFALVVIDQQMAAISMLRTAHPGLGLIPAREFVRSFKGMLDTREMDVRPTYSLGWDAKKFMRAFVNQLRVTA